MHLAKTLLLTMLKYVRSALKQKLDKALLRMFIHVVSEARDSL